MQRRIKERLVQGTRVRVYVPTRLPVPLRESVSIVRVEAGKHRPHCYSIPASILDFLEHFPEISSRPTNDRLDTAVDYGTRNNKRCCLFFFFFEKISILSYVVFFFIMLSDLENPGKYSTFCFQDNLIRTTNIMAR